MRFLVAMDSFKGSLSALEAVQAVAEGLHEIFPDAELDMLPVADGGEGTVNALVAATAGEIRSALVRDPLGRPVQAHWGILGDGHTAVVEMAAASGLPLLKPDEKDALRACSWGTGELMSVALDHLFQTVGYSEGHLIVGIGGSATNDGGMGALRALGLRLLDADGRDLPVGGAALQNLATIDGTALHPLLQKIKMTVACDVDNPLCGAKGASVVFGPQKGATPNDVRVLDSALQQYAQVAAEITGRDCAATAGSGTAGGMGAGLLFFTNAVLQSGIELVMEATDFVARAALADVIITGEGKTDAQSAYGKVISGIAAVGRELGKPVICISGAVEPESDVLLERGITALQSCVSTLVPLELCLEQAKPLLMRATANVGRLIKIGMPLH